MRYIKSFFGFWQDFLIGDSPEVAVGALVILGIAFGLHASLAAVVVVPVAVILLLVLSMLRPHRAK